MRKRTLFRWLAALFGGALLVALALAVNVIWFRPFSIDLFYEKVFIEFALENPELLTSFGLAEQFGYRRHNAHLDDVSDAKAGRDFDMLRRDLAELRAYDIESQSTSQRLSTRVLAFFLQSQLDGERFRYHAYPVSQLGGVHIDTPEFLISQHRIADRRGAEDYLSRLGEVARKFGEVDDGLALRERRGIVPPRFVIERVLAQMREFVAKPPLDNPLYTNFAAKVDKLDGLAAGDAAALKARCAEAIRTGVLPAYRTLMATLERELPRAPTDDGVWRLPDGDAYYAQALRTQTTTRLTPQQVHDLGVAEVSRIDAQMASLLAAQRELRAGETPGAALSRLALSPRFLYADTDEGRRAALADYGAMLDDQLARSRAIIGLVPKARLEVRRVPEFKEMTAPGAYYFAPAIDGTRPGVFYANLRDMREVPKFGMRTLAMHEGIPGHHFQIALAQEQTGGPTFRRVLPFTAYSEGWALYAESLGNELGVYRDDPFGELGWLQSEMFRAVRLVVDTGIHYKRWTREQAIRYMVEHTGMSESAVVSEIERYIVNPGQACAYMVGMLTIRAARTRAETALGPRFDAAAEKAFHDVVLRGGALPLEVLDEQVDAWIAERAR